jgi:nitroimidazol reductase NimA-like FMN-containing flavoprotein (pyridoxamine 5'-phosphate oxidase superfamily)
METELENVDEITKAGLDELDSVECWELLGTQPVGRVAVVVDHYPLVVPVNYAVDGASVVFRSSAGSKLDRIHGAKVAFEVDQIDPVHRTGWSVLVKGIATGLNVRGNRDLADRSGAAGARPWAAGEREYLVRIVAEEITGRRITPAGLPPTDARGYL